MSDEAAEERPVPVLAYAEPEADPPEPEGHWTNFIATGWLCGMGVRLLAAELRGSGIGGAERLIVGPLFVTIIGLLATMAAVGLVRRVARPMRPRLRPPRLASVIGAMHAILVVAVWFEIPMASPEMLSREDKAILFTVPLVVPVLAPLVLLRRTA